MKVFFRAKSVFLNNFDTFWKKSTQLEVTSFAEVINYMSKVLDSDPGSGSHFANSQRVPLLEMAFSLIKLN